MKVYSPSATKTWERCPLLREAQRAGWHTVVHDYGDLAMIAGDAFSAGMEAHNLARMSPGEPASVPVVAAQTLFQERVEHVKASGGRFEFTAKNQEAALVMEEGLLEALAFTVENDPAPPEWQVVAVEQSLGPEAGYARPDVVYELPPECERDESGEQVGCRVVRLTRDYKFKLASDKKYDTERVNEYLASGQAHHYLHFGHSRYFNSLIVVAKPKPRFVGLTAYLEYDGKMINRWVAGQEGKWQAMHMQETGLLPLWESEQHEDKWGRCEMWEACLLYDRDPQRMLNGGYIKIERR